MKHWHLSVRSDQVFRCVTEASQNMQSHNENQDNLKGGVQKLDYTTTAATHPNWVAPQIFLQIPRAHEQG